MLISVSSALSLPGNRKRFRSSKRSLWYDASNRSASRQKIADLLSGVSRRVVPVVGVRHCRRGRALFYARSENGEKRLLASSCPSIGPSARNTLARTGRILMKFHIWDFFRKYVEKMSSFFKVWQEWRVLYVKTFSHLWQYLAKLFLEWEMF